MASEGLHEPLESLSSATIELHRAIVSLMEELEAIDWYGQRVDASQDAELKAIIAHNRGEEIEHAIMTLEWIRRHDAQFDAKLREILFKDGPITGDHGEGGGSGEASAVSSALGIGNLGRPK